jgi:Domain of unknown function (DUF4034)
VFHGWQRDREVECGALKPLTEGNAFMKKSFTLVIASLSAVAAFAQTAPPTSPPQVPHSLREMLCGSQGMVPTSLEIPTIGCFRVPGGGTAAGMFDGRQFVITVDAGGEPKCRSDGAAVDCSGCVGQSVAQCPVRLMVFSHNADKSVLFSVQRKADGNRYLFRIDTWNAYLAQKQTQQAVEAAQPHTLQPALPPGMAAQPTDGPGALSAVGFQAQSAYGGGQFAKLDTLIEALSQPDQLTDDGLPRLQGVYDGLSSFLEIWKDWDTEFGKIAEWRREYPESYGPDLVEALLWREWAWNARGGGYADSVTPEGWKLFAARIAHADEVLGRSKHRASRSPLWYEIRLAIARDAGWDHQHYGALFDEATKQFSWYVPFYLFAANYLSPKWDGSYAAVDALARRTTSTPLGADHSLYARIYWDVAQGEELEFQLFQDSQATWPQMKAGFEGLMKRYPKSKWNLNAYAYFACLADDASTYAVVRAQIGQNLIADAWASNHSPDVCDEHLLGHT